MACTMLLFLVALQSGGITLPSPCHLEAQNSLSLHSDRSRSHSVTACIILQDTCAAWSVQGVLQHAVEHKDGSQAETGPYEHTSLGPACKNAQILCEYQGYQDIVKDACCAPLQHGV